MGIEKHKIIQEFKRLIEQIIFDIDHTSGRNKLINQYRLKSISNALKIIEQYHKSVIDVEDIKNIKKIKGVGDGTIKRINEIIKTGKLSEIKITNKDRIYLDMVKQLEDIYGIGPVTAYKLFKEYKIKSVDELINKVDTGEIAVSNNVIIGLKYVGKLDTFIPRKEIDDFREYILNVMLKIDANLFGSVCGSYRRLKETSGDIDLVITHDKYKTSNRVMKHNFIDIIVSKLIDDHIIIESLTKTDVKTKYMGIFKWKNSKPRRIDIRMIPTESYYSAILYFTGSKDFNKTMRLNAIAHGYTLNEYGLFDENDNMFTVKSEKEIFDLLGMEYVTPDKR